MRAKWAKKRMRRRQRKRRKSQKWDPAGSTHWHTTLTGLVRFQCWLIANYINIKTNAPEGRSAFLCVYFLKMLILYLKHPCFPFFSIFSISFLSFIIFTIQLHFNGQTRACPAFFRSSNVSISIPALANLNISPISSKSYEKRVKTRFRFFPASWDFSFMGTLINLIKINKTKVY